MKNKFFILLITLITAIVVSSCNGRHGGDAQHSHKTYTCSMHPQVIRSEPGNCPICGMTLVEKKSGMEGDTLTGLETVLGATFQKFLSTLDTVKPVKLELPVAIKANGIIIYDTRFINNISSRVDGRIDKLYVRYSFQPVVKGQKLFEIYSPELMTAQQDLLFLIKNDSKESDLINSAREKLRLLGMNETELKEVENSGKPKNLVAIFSNYSGYVVGRDFSGNISATPESKGMSEKGNNIKSTESISIKEGMYVTQGETVFKVVSNESVWALLSVNNSDIAAIKTGQNAEIFVGGTAAPAYKGIINYIEATNPDNNRFVNVRVYMNNTGRQFKIGQLVTAKIEAGNHTGLWVPKNAILNLGKQKIALVKSGNVFVPAVVTTGLVNGDRIEITSGIDAETVITSNAQFMADSESFIKTVSHER
ncbi:MAG: HlyD family efflux transporter periplasmic adaptor subunit [Bacteroidota bacterium]